MSTPIPLSGNDASHSVTGGTGYFYINTNAGRAAMASMVRGMTALEQQQVLKNQALAAIINQHNEPGKDVVISATVVGAIAGVIGAGAAIGGTAAAVGSLGMSVASMAMQSDASDVGNFEIVIRNETGTPMVCYDMSNGGCSTANNVPPLEPGGSGSIEVIQNGGFEEGAYISLYFLVGGGVVTTDESNGEPIALQPVKCLVKYEFNGSDWLPTFIFDGGNGYEMGPNMKGLLVASFHPDDDVNSMGFAYSGTLVQKSSGMAEVTFMPEAATFD